PEIVKSFAMTCHILTFDLEHVDVTPLFDLKRKIRIVPAPETLTLIQNKFEQRQALYKAGLPVPKFSVVSNKEDLEKKLPIVQKSLGGGYDGRGTVILKSKEDLEKALPLPSLVEEYVEIEKEIALMVVRNDKGEFRIYDPVEMVFHHEG
ncbi:ATP-grasp domain-containing protein, partial [Acinetobacter baumannii]|uniref:ATP-grasp domain-containing protein n=1 Tax=Acinetobacter baumannii TaxID=470 RepID=UPI00115FAA91